MPINEAERRNLIEKLEDFRNEYVRYGELVLKVKRRGTLDKQKKEEFLRLCSELPQKYGGLKEVIEEYAGSAVLPLQGGRREYEVFTSSFNHTPFSQEVLFALVDKAITTVNIAIGKLKSLSLNSTRSQNTSATHPPKAFIAHGGETPALSKLKQFINALDVMPMIAEEQPSEDRSIGKQVDWCLAQCECAIILATKGDIDGKTGEFIPRGNILIEIGKCQERFPGRIVYLIEQGTKFPTDISEKVRARFSPQSMDRAFTKVAKELVAFGIIKAVKPSE